MSRRTVRTVTSSSLASLSVVGHRFARIAWSITMIRFRGGRTAWYMANLLTVAGHAAVAHVSASGSQRGLSAHFTRSESHRKRGDRTSMVTPGKTIKKTSAGRSAPRFDHNLTCSDLASVSTLFGSKWLLADAGW
jgi:hypothetical protein